MFSSRILSIFIDILIFLFFALLPVGQYGLFFALLPVGQYGLFFALLPVGQYGLKLRF